MIDYDGRTFYTAAGETAEPDGNGPVGHYHQQGDVVWAEFAGGKVTRGSLVGHSDPDGVLELAYAQLLATGEVMAGRCRSVPTVLGDGRIRLTEQWERFGPGGSSGESVIEEPVPASAPSGHS